MSKSGKMLYIFLIKVVESLGSSSLARVRLIELPTSSYEASSYADDNMTYFNAPTLISGARRYQVVIFTLFWQAMLYVNVRIFIIKYTLVLYNDVYY